MYNYETLNIRNFSSHAAAQEANSLEFSSIF